MLSLPPEIVALIIEYVDSVDLRRYYGVYRKLPIRRYLPLQSVIRQYSPEHSETWMDVYRLPNIEEIPFRQEWIIFDDHLETRAEIDEEGVHVDMCIYRLRKKTGHSLQEIESEISQYWFKANLCDYYWNYFYFSYTRK